MKIICSTNMPYALEAFQTLGETTIKEGRGLTNADVRDVDLLAVRSTTKVGRALLAGTRVRFVGTATIGIDHMDIPWLEQAGIRWCSAAGCNANSVSEYMTAALLWLARKHRFVLEGKTIGIIGIGNVGRGVVQKARALGLRVLANDPPRARQEGPSGFVELDQILAEADIITFHVPLAKSGSDATWHMGDKALFARMKSGAIVFNAARGPVLVADELLAAMDRGTVAHAVLDTWEGEPDYRREVLARVDLGTPHIAGHSFEGKVTGTLMVYREACRFLGVAADWSPDALLPVPMVPEIRLDVAGRPDEDVLADIVLRVYDIEADDRRMRAGDMADAKKRAGHFDDMRCNYPERREFPCTAVTLQNASPALCKKVEGLGFRLRPA